MVVVRRSTLDGRRHCENVNWPIDDFVRCAFLTSYATCHSTYTHMSLHFKLDNCTQLKTFSRSFGHHSQLWHAWKAIHSAPSKLVCLAVLYLEMRQRGGTGKCNLLFIGRNGPRHCGKCRCRTYTQTLNASANRSCANRVLTLSIWLVMRVNIFMCSLNARTRPWSMKTSTAMESMKMNFYVIDAGARHT